MNVEECKEIAIRLPVYLIEVFTAQANYTGRSFNDELVHILERAIFLDPDDLDVLKTTAEAKAELAEIQSASMEEGMALLSKIRERNRIVNDLSKLNPTRQ